MFIIIIAHLHPITVCWRSRYQCTLKDKRVRGKVSKNMRIRAQSRKSIITYSIKFNHKHLPLLLSLLISFSFRSHVPALQ